jgi:hypothetical protein
VQQSRQPSLKGNHVASYCARVLTLTPSHLITRLHRPLLDTALSIDNGRTSNIDIQLAGRSDRRVLHPSVHPHLLPPFLGRRISHSDPAPRPRCADPARPDVLPLRCTSRHEARLRSPETYQATGMAQSCADCSAMDLLRVTVRITIYDAPATKLTSCPVFYSFGHIRLFQAASHPPPPPTIELPSLAKQLLPSSVHTLYSLSF